MRKLIPAVALAGLCQAACLAAAPTPTFRKLTLSDKFYAEGAYHADFNKDGKLDMVAGPFWFEGPDFQKKHEIRSPQTYDRKAFYEEVNP